MLIRLLRPVLFAALLPAFAVAGPADDYEDGMTALRAGKHETAIEKLGAAIKSNALNEKALAAAYLARGTAKRFLGKPRAAALDFAAVTALDPENADAWLYLGDARLQTGDLHAALVNLDQAIALAPKNGFARMVRGDARFAGADWQGAREDYDAAISRAPDLAGAFLGRAKTLEMLKNPEAALGDYKVALELDPRLEAARAAIERLEKTVAAE